MMVRYVVSFSIDLLQAKQRHRFNPVTRTAYTPDETRDAERRVGIAYRNASIREYGRVVVAPRGVPVAIKLDFYKKEPKSYPSYLPRWLRPRIPFVTKPDASNMQKMVEDGLNGIAYHDDSQLTATHAYKHDRNGVTEDRTDVTVMWDVEE
jgi:Holliday junction resolvase RusA-like endonuclease